MNKIKVALIGNMNNNNFVLLRYLIDLGVDAYLLILKNEPIHFSPEFDSYNIEKYNDRIKKMKWGDRKEWFFVKKKEIENDLKDYKILIGTDLSPAFCGRASRLLDIFIPHGSDLGHFTFYRLTWPNKLIQTWMAVYMQRKYLPKVKYFHMETNIELYEKRWNIFKGASIRWEISIPLVYKEISETVLPINTFNEKIKKLQEESDILIYYHVRHVWGGDEKNDANQKGTENFIKAIALFKERNPKIILNIITFEYGTKIHKSQNLIKKLNLEKNFNWFPIGIRKDIILGMKYADLVVGEFVHSWITSSVMVEALSLNKPIIAYRDDKRYFNLYDELYYILNAKTENDICEKIEYYLKNKNEVIKNASNGWSWYENRIIKPSIEMYRNIIEN
jgi:hypothetical protein